MSNFCIGSLTSHPMIYVWNTARSLSHYALHLKGNSTTAHFFFKVDAPSTYG
jgi:hypothetical protein